MKNTSNRQEDKLMKAKVFQEHPEKNIIPFWNRMVDNENGGFYGYADSDGNPDKNSVKGCILNSRILWFYSASYQLLKKTGTAGKSWPCLCISF